MTAWTRPSRGCYRNSAGDEIIGSSGEWFIFPHDDHGMYGAFSKLAAAKLYVEREFATILSPQEEWERAYDEAVKQRDWQTCAILLNERETEAA